MSFLSVEFAILLLVLVCFLPGGARPAKLVTVVASLVFYAFAGLTLVALALFSSVVDFCICGRLSHTKRQAWLVSIAVANNLSILLLVKAAYFYGWISSDQYGILPVGISFYSLQSISYIFDVYRKKIVPAESFIDYISYILFFPQLVAGPIERANDLMPQLNNIRLAPAPEILYAMQLFSFGAYLKLVVANRLFNTVHKVAGANAFDLTYLLNGILATVYVYADFFAYTLMARGIAKLLCIELHINFDRPFARRGIRDFWASWHISLTRWIADYFYRPTMAAYGDKALVRVLMPLASMILIGLWHGITLNFFVFGFCVGLFILLLHLIDNLFREEGCVQKAIFERFFMYFTMAFMGNVFLHLDASQIQSMLQGASFKVLNYENASVYMNRSFLIGIISLAPLLLREFLFPKLFTSYINGRRSLITVLFFFVLTITLGVKGGEHVYFQF